MSRVGKEPIKIPNNISVDINKNGTIIFKSNKTIEELNTFNRVGIRLDEGKLIFEEKQDIENSKSFWGLYRSLANNIVKGFIDGFSKILEVNGVGYKVALKGKNLELFLGFSHPIVYPIPEDIQISVAGNSITIKGANKQKVGHISADIRSFRSPEPYKGKGIKYADEYIIRKAGKSAK